MTEVSIKQKPAIDLQFKSMDWFLYDMDLLHERVKENNHISILKIELLILSKNWRVDKMNTLNSFGVGGPVYLQLRRNLQAVYPYRKKRSWSFFEKFRRVFEIITIQVLGLFLILNVSQLNFSHHNEWRLFLIQQTVSITTQLVLFCLIIKTLHKFSNNQQFFCFDSLLIQFFQYEVSANLCNF